MYFFGLKEQINNLKFFYIFLWCSLIVWFNKLNVIVNWSDNLEAGMLPYGPAWWWSSGGRSSRRDPRRCRPRPWSCSFPRASGWTPSAPATRAPTRSLTAPCRGRAQRHCGSFETIRATCWQRRPIITAVICVIPALAAANPGITAPAVSPAPALICKSLRRQLFTLSPALHFGITANYHIIYLFFPLTTFLVKSGKIAGIWFGIFTEVEW